MIRFELLGLEGLGENNYLAYFKLGRLQYEHIIVGDGYCRGQECPINNQTSPHNS
jgi:hypothetical protein